MLGLAFKPHTDDLRDAPAIDIARKLLERGAQRQGARSGRDGALPRGASRHCEVICCETPEEVADDADALVLVTEWPQYLETGLGSAWPRACGHPSSWTAGTYWTRPD